MRFFGRQTASIAVTGTDVDVQTAHALQQSGAELVDVREPEEFSRGHAAGARSIPLGRLADRAGELPKDRTVLLICASGGRSKAALSILQRKEFSDARNVLGGTAAWQRAGLPVQR